VTGVFAPLFLVEQQTRISQFVVIGRLTKFAKTLIHGLTRVVHAIHKGRLEIVLGRRCGAFVPGMVGEVHIANHLESVGCLLER